MTQRRAEPRSRKRRGTAKRRIRGASGALRLAAGAAIVIAVSLAVNGLYQAVRKPSELLFPVSGALAKTPSETWASYAPLFRRYATTSITPELLASLAQAEAAGNPVAHTYWRWSWPSAPFEIYRPASSSVGMYQMTDAAFAEARRWRIQDHTAVESGAATVYFRVLPQHAVELAAGYLDRHVAAALARARSAASPLQRRHLAALIHLCGAAAGEAYVRRGFRLDDAERCGDHDPRVYLSRIDAFDRDFTALAARD
jgi:hypothetical protein